MLKTAISAFTGRTIMTTLNILAAGSLRAAWPDVVAAFISSATAQLILHQHGFQSPA